MAPLDVEPLLQRGEVHVHDNDYVRDKRAFIRTMIANRRASWADGRL